MKKKFAMITMAMIADKKFRDYVEKEFHIFFSIVEDVYRDSEGEFEEILEDILEAAKPYIKILYNELEQYYL